VWVQAQQTHASALPRRVLGKHRCEFADFGVSRKASEQGDADVHHTLGFRDHDRAPPVM
jgi:hypothetical protein